MRDDQERRVVVLRSDESRYEVELTAVYLEETPWGRWRLDVRAPSSPDRTFVDSDVFDAMIAYRAELECTGEKLLCAGARTDVWPSGMGRSMGGGRMAYVMRYGEQAREKDLIDIFEPAPAALVSSVREQRDYAERWISFFRDRLNSSS